MRFRIIKKLFPILRRVRHNEEQRRKAEAKTRDLDIEAYARSAAKVAKPTQILASDATAVLAQFDGSNLTYQLEVRQNDTIKLGQVDLKLKDCPGLQKLVNHVDTYLKNFNAKRSSIKVMTTNGLMMPVKSMKTWAEAMISVTSDANFDGCVPVVVDTHQGDLGQES